LKRLAPLLGLLFAISTAAAAGDLAEAPYVWRNVVIGGGGFSPDIVFSPAEKG